MQIEQWLDTELGIQIWKKKYRHGDEDFEQWLDRVSGGNQDIRRLIKEKKFLFGGRTLTNRGVENGSMSNCYSSGFVQDNLVDIMEVNTKLALTYKAQGGQGVSLSKIRPKGTLIKGLYESDGIVPIMEMYNTTTQSIMQGGCIHEDELVLTDSGYKEIKNITIGDRVWTKEGFIEVNFVFDKGIQEVFEVKTSKGSSIRTTIDHKYSIDGFNTKKLSELKVGDNINLITKHKFEEVDFNNLAYFLGVFNGDGYINPTKNGGTITLHKSQKYIGDKIIEIIQSLGFKAYYAKDKLQNALRVYLVKDFIDYLNEKGLLKNHADSIIIPDFIIKGNDSIKASYIAGALDSDGCIYSTSFKYNTICEEYAKKLQILLFSLGFFPTLSVIERDETRQLIYEIRDSFRLNQCNIPSLKIEHSSVQFAKNSKYSTPYTIESEGFTRDECEHLKKVSKTDKIGLYTYLNSTSNTENETRAPIIFDSITKIESIGMAHVYDLSLVSEHLFACNGFYISNSRKGALMISLDIKHKEAETFITIKSDPTKINKANLSVEIDDEFMEAVAKFYETGEEVTLLVSKTYEQNHIEYEIVPIKLYKLLMSRAWQSAEPGVIFTNEFRNYNLMQYVDEYQIETSNPCGEQPLPKDGACNLGSINLSEYVLKPFTKEAEFDYDAFVKDVMICIRALDEVIDENLGKHGLPEQTEVSRKYRNIGLGIMGLADAFIKLGLRYGSYDSVIETNTILESMFVFAIAASSKLAKEKGVFPGYDPRIFDSDIIANVMHRFLDAEIVKADGLRNCSLLSIAPTGSLGTMFNVSTGIEPNFAFQFNRKTESLNGNNDTNYTINAGIVKEYQDYLDSIGQPFTELPNYFVSSYDIAWDDRIDVQATAQHYVDTAISATINLKNSITQEEVEKLYLYAWNEGLKGITIYRDGCRDAVLSLKAPQKKEEFFHRPLKLQAKVVHFINDSKPWVAFIGIKDDKPFEVFTGPADMEMFPIPKTVLTGSIIKVKIPGQDSRYDFRYTDSYGYENTLGGLSRCFDKEFYNYARLVSGMLRQQVEVSSILAIVDGMQFENESLNSWKNGVMRALKEFVPDGTTTTEICPDCGSPIIFVGGCKQCSSCGWSKC